MRNLTVKEYDKIEQFIYTYPTKNKQGFVVEEEQKILKLFPEINMEKYHDALMGNTCMVSPEGQTIIYHCDIFKALLCGIENRNLTVEEWD